MYGDAGYLGMEKREEFQTGNESENRDCRITTSRAGANT